MSAPVSPVSVVVGGEQGPLRALMFGFASYDEAGAFGPAAGIGHLGQVYHMSPDLRLFAFWLPVLGILSVWLFWLLVTAVTAVIGVFVLVTFAGEGRYPSWVVYRYLPDGALDIRRPAHTDGEPDVASAARLGEAVAPRRVGTHPYWLNNRVRVVTPPMPQTQPGRQSVDSRVQDPGVVSNVVGRRVARA